MQTIYGTCLRRYAENVKTESMRAQLLSTRDIVSLFKREQAVPSEMADDAICRGGRGEKLSGPVSVGKSAAWDATTQEGMIPMNEKSNGTTGNKTIHVKDGTEYVPYQVGDEVLNHTDYLKLGEQEFLRSIGAKSVPDAETRLDATITEDIDGNGMTRFHDCASDPDVVCTTPTRICLVEAKPTVNEMRSLRAVEQVKNYLYTLATDDSGRDVTLVISTPYHAVGEANRTVARAKNALENGEMSSTGEAYSELMRGLSRVNVRIVSEITGKDIPAPEDFAIRQRVFGGKGLVNVPVIGGKTYEVPQRLVNIDSLRFDCENNRLIGSEGTPLSQDECYRRLLDDADIEHKNVEKAYQRRREMLSALTVKNALDVFVDDDGNDTCPIVVDGNSRLAQARYITQEANSAPGYEYVLVNEYRKDKGFDYDLIAFAKNEKQHETKVDHDTVQDAFLIYRLWRADNSVSDIRRFFTGYYSDRIIEMSAQTILLLKENGIKDSDIRLLYFAANSLTRAAKFDPVRMIPKGMRDAHELDMSLIIRRLLKEAEYVRNSKDGDVSDTYLASPCFKNSVIAALRMKNKPADVKKALKDWCLGTGMEDPAQFEELVKDAKAQRTKTPREILLDNIEDATNLLKQTSYLMSSIISKPADDDGNECLSDKDWDALYVKLGKLNRQLNKTKKVTEEQLS